MTQFYALPGRRVAHALIGGAWWGLIACERWMHASLRGTRRAPASMPRCKKCERIIQRGEK